MRWPFYLLVLVLVLAKGAPTVHLSSPAATPSGSPSPAPVSLAAKPVDSPLKQMTMFSVHVRESREDQQRQLMLYCRLDSALSNLEARILVVGTTAEDVVGGGGRILIPSGSKVVGQGFCDAERTRFLGRGRWTFFANDHQISAAGVLLDGGRREGLAGTEMTDAVDPTKAKEAIYRDGIFLYVPAGTAFLLQLRGDVSVQELGSAADH